MLVMLESASAVIVVHPGSHGCWWPLGMWGDVHMGAVRGLFR